MINKKNWEEFRSSGLLWYTNMILHAFGWSIVFEMKNKEIVNVYPARVKFRGFSADAISKGYLNLNRYMADNSEVLLKEAEEE